MLFSKKNRETTKRSIFAGRKFEAWNSPPTFLHVYYKWKSGYMSTQNKQRWLNLWRRNFKIQGCLIKEKISQDQVWESTVTKSWDYIWICLCSSPKTYWICQRQGKAINYFKKSLWTSDKWTEIGIQLESQSCESKYWKRNFVSKKEQ